MSKTKGRQSQLQMIITFGIFFLLLLLVFFFYFFFFWYLNALSFELALSLSLSHVNQYKLLHLCSHLSRINHSTRNTEKYRKNTEKYEYFPADAIASRKSLGSTAAACLLHWGRQRNCSYALICTSFDFLVYSSALIHSDRAMYIIHLSSVFFLEKLPLPLLRYL